MLHALRLAAAADPAATVVVLGADAPRLRALLARRGGAARVVVNARWKEGLSRSLAKGLEAIPAAAGVLVLLVDQPYVTRARIARLAAVWRARPARPVAAHYAPGRIGVPAILTPALRRRLAAPSASGGDRGARRLLEAAEDLALVDMPEAAFDLDTAEDLAALARARPARLFNRYRARPRHRVPLRSPKPAPRPNRTPDPAPPLRSPVPRRSHS